MQAHFFKWFGPSALAAAAILGSSSNSSAAETLPAPVFTAQPCCQLCPEVSNPALYVTRYQQNFTTLFQGQGEWLFRTNEDLRTVFDTSPEGYSYMKQIHDVFKSKGIEVVLVYQPTRGLVDRERLPADVKAKWDYDLALKNYKGMLGRFAAMGYTVPDLTPLTDEHLPADQAEHDFYFRGDQHWTPYGSEKTARIVAPLVKKMPAFAGIPQKEFESHKMGRMGKKGTLHNVAGQFCNTSYAIQYMDQFTTEPKADSNDSDLFSDSGTPQITLVGTSHSDKNYNFAGFLEQNMGADVLNVAFPGGGLEGSMLEYLASDAFKKHPPKIIIWEFSPLYALDQETIYRQMMALLDDGCANKPAVMSESTELKTGPNMILVNGKDAAIKEITNNKYQVDIQYADTSVKTMHAILWYMNGRHETLKIEKPDTSETNGRFAFELRNDKDWPTQELLAIQLEGPDVGTAPQKIDAKICTRNVFPGVNRQIAQAEPRG